MHRCLVTLASFVVLVAIGASAPLSCPGEDDIYPCTCTRLAYALHIKCANFDDSKVLIKTFKVLRDYKELTVLLHGLRLTDVLPNDLFNGLDINELKVEKSKLKFPKPAFSGLDDTLHILNVAQHSLIKSSENFSIARLNKLQELNIKSNPLATVKNQWLNGKIPNVEKIRLERDTISTIEDKAFADLTNLVEISIADNSIAVFKRSMFPRPANKLRRLDLSGNWIKSLPFDFFFEMPALREVILSGNDIDTLPEDTWKPIWENLDILYIKENKMVCNESLNWIKNVKWPKEFEGTCAFPSNVRDYLITDVYKT